MIMPRWPIQTPPFELPTDGQKKVVNEICFDLRSCEMNRLLQGDVGSEDHHDCDDCRMQRPLTGKGNPRRVPIPWHVETTTTYHDWKITGIFGRDTVAESCSGALVNRKSMNRSQKKTKRNTATRAARQNLLIGNTHALFQQDVNLKSYLSVVIDEQHASSKATNVVHRWKRSDKAECPSMAATLPFACDYSFWGNGMSILESEIPRGRQPIKMFLGSRAGNGAEIFNFVERVKFKKGDKRMISPLIEESEHLDVQKRRRDLSHDSQRISRIKWKWGCSTENAVAEEKEAVMADLKPTNHSTASTTAIEVGWTCTPQWWRFWMRTDSVSPTPPLRGRVGRTTCLAVALVASPKTENRKKAHAH